MIRAYDELYLENARRSLARMLDFAVYELEYDLTDFFDMFLKSDIAESFENGECSIIAGKSGVELAYDIIAEIEGKSVQIEVSYTANRSREYWLGWALAYYQWYTSMPFEEIVSYIPIQEIVDLYVPYHEMDIRHFVDIMNEKYHESKKDTNLKIFRNRLGISQKELAENSNVPLRTLQQYEQRQKNINKAQVEYLIRLSKVLCCEVEDIVEKI